MIFTSVVAYNYPVARKGKLPERLRPFFWDYPFSRLSMEEDRDLVIHRILSDGSWDAVRWLRREVGDQELRQWLISHRGRGLTARQLRFWEIVYDLPARQVNEWVRNVRESVWGKR
jgi:hypothetical protein